MTAHRSLLRSRVARRVVVLFVVCALIPMTALALLTRHAVRGQLEEQYAGRLRGDAKSAAMGMVERLGLAHAGLDVVARAIGQQPPGDSQGMTLLPELPRGSLALAWHEDASARTTILRGDPGDGVLAGLAAVPPNVDGAAQLHVAADGTGARKRLFLRTRPGGEDATGTLVLELDPAVVLDLGADSLRPPSTEACVLDDTGAPIGCSADLTHADTLEVAAGCSAIATGRRVVRVAGDLYVACWSAPLRARYGVRHWTVALVARHADVMAPTAAFGRTFLAGLGLSLLVVILLSLSMIRHSLRPLEELKRGVDRVAARDFRTPIALESRDEFQEVADAFDTMMSTLAATFAELDALQMGTLRALALAIDAKSSWTAGHSQRVTELALEIGREMALSETELKELEVGGLLHDIGKLGVPGRILDKAGPLTSEEVTIMRQHPQLGAQILEPIPSIRGVLPIVLQHHERFDGGGYPGGLAGHDIALPARIFAVADVFDALHSERPYRRSMPAAVAIERVAAESGRHFDPRVVSAFLAVMDRRAEGGPGARPMPEPGALTCADAQPGQAAPGNQGTAAALGA